GLSVRSVRSEASPRRISARASLTQVGQRLSVSRGQPSGGRSRSLPRGMGWSLHFGWKGPASGARRFAGCIRGQTALAESETIFSRARTGSIQRAFLAAGAVGERREGTEGSPERPLLSMRSENPGPAAVTVSARSRYRSVVPESEQTLPLATRL